MPVTATLRDRCDAHIERCRRNLAVARAALSVARDRLAQLYSLQQQYGPDTAVAAVERYRRDVADYERFEQEYLDIITGIEGRLCDRL
jgi:hypothetical protein